MAIPDNIKEAVRALLLIPEGYTNYDNLMQQVYERIVQNTVEATDWTAEREDINAVQDQSIYTVNARVTRILAVLHDQVQLAKATSSALDLADPDWQAEASGTPEWWVWDKIPPALDGLSSVTPVQFAVHPAPDTSASGLNGLMAYEIATPTDDDPPFTWADHFLSLKTAAELVRQSPEERLASGQDDLQLAAFLGTLAELWRIALERVIPRV